MQKSILYFCHLLEYPHKSWSIKLWMYYIVTILVLVVAFLIDSSWIYNSAFAQKTKIGRRTTTTIILYNECEN
jgi:hypothetical protein